MEPDIEWDLYERNNPHCSLHPDPESPDEIYAAELTILLESAEYAPFSDLDEIFDLIEQKQHERFMTRKREKKSNADEQAFWDAHYNAAQEAAQKELEAGIRAKIAAEKAASKRMRAEREERDIEKSMRYDTFGRPRAPQRDYRPHIMDSKMNHSQDKKPPRKK